MLAMLLRGEEPKKQFPYNSRFGELKSWEVFNFGPNFIVLICTNSLFFYIELFKVKPHFNF